MLKKEDRFISQLITNMNKLYSAVFHHDDSDKNNTMKHAYINHFKEWLVEKAVKNQLIKHKRKNENVKRPRQRVYWCEFGINVGSEFSFPHFAVVIKEFDKTAIVVPISSEKEDDAEFKNASNYYVPIGKLSGLPREQRECYALVNQIKTVSKTRLSDYKDKENNKFVKMSLTKEQMDAVLDSLKKIATQETK